MSDEPPHHLHLIHTDGDPELDMRGLRMWAYETAMHIVRRGPKEHERCVKVSEQIVRYVLQGDRDA